MEVNVPYIALRKIIIGMDITRALVREARYAIAGGQEQIANMVGILICISGYNDYLIN